MSRALELAERGRNTCTPNPNVGCVIAKGARVIGEGWHERAGRAACRGPRARSCKESAEGATVYVTLEPCSHVGRTGPCTERLIAARVARVVTAIQDPYPEVDGRGVKRLREAGIRVEVGPHANGSRGSPSRVPPSRAHRPPVDAPQGRGLARRPIALANGKSRWITGEEARRDVHALRARSCAMLTGIGTVLLDDPELTGSPRAVPTPAEARR
jgi:diaminohydroxyphosphoribosylaminopyrimidine deaminase/5-amino-6-(5-phosphoribosylamino)uracil reductase